MKILQRLLPVALTALGAVSLSAQTVTPTVPPVSRVHQLKLDDQSENPGNISEAEYYRHGDARRAEVRKLLDEGKIVTGEDFSDASLIFQHGKTSDDFLFAHILAVEGLTHGASADKWIIAATLDRYLQSVNQPQVFGTQFPGDKSPGNTPKPQVDPHVLNIQRTQQPYNPQLLPEFVRQDFCVPNVAQQEKNLATFNTGHRPEGKLIRAKTCAR